MPTGPLWADPQRPSNIDNPTISVDRSGRLRDHTPMNERLVDLEARLAFQERALQELNDVVVHQQRDIDRLTKEVEVLRTQVRNVMPALVAPQSEETPPPHY